MIKQYVVTDPSTGEIVTENAILTQFRRKLKGLEWVIVFQYSLKKLYNDENLHGQDYKVFLCLLEACNWENWITCTQQELADRLKMKKSHVNRSIKKLETGGYLVKMKRDGRQLYTLNSGLACKGDVRKIQSSHLKAHRV